MDHPRSPHLLLLLGAVLALGGFAATLGLARLAAAPTTVSAHCQQDCAPRPWLDPEKARRFAAVFRE